MSHLLDRLLFFRKNVDTFSHGLGVVTREDRSWEDGYRNRWDHDIDITRGCLRCSPRRWDL
jgi:nitrate reductase alpha subunit